MKTICDNPLPLLIAVMFIFGGIAYAVKTSDPPDSLFEPEIEPSLIQTTENYRLARHPSLSVSGSSSVKDWKMEANDAQGSGVFQVSDGKLQNISSLKVTMKAKELKSGTRGMDNNAYDALKSSKYPEIAFELMDFSGGESSGKAKGRLTIAGVTREVSIPVQIRKQGTGFVFTGEVPTKLTDFSISPPTALLGSIRTRDEITISFNAHFQPKN